MSLDLTQGQAKTKETYYYYINKTNGEQLGSNNLDDLSLIIYEDLISNYLQDNSTDNPLCDISQKIYTDFGDYYGGYSYLSDIIIHEEEKDNNKIYYTVQGAVFTIYVNRTLTTEEIRDFELNVEHEEKKSSINIKSKQVSSLENDKEETLLISIEKELYDFMDISFSAYELSQAEPILGEVEYNTPSGIITIKDDDSEKANFINGPLLGKLRIGQDDNSLVKKYYSDSFSEGNVLYLFQVVHQTAGTGAATPDDYWCRGTVYLPYDACGIVDGTYSTEIGYSKDNTQYMVCKDYNSKKEIYTYDAYYNNGGSCVLTYFFKNSFLTKDQIVRIFPECIIGQIFYINKLKEKWAWLSQNESINSTGQMIQFFIKSNESLAKDNWIIRVSQCKTWSAYIDGTEDQDEISGFQTFVDGYRIFSLRTFNDRDYESLPSKTSVYYLVPSAEGTYSEYSASAQYSDFSYSDEPTLIFTKNTSDDWENRPNIEEYTLAYTTFENVPKIDQTSWETRNFDAYAINGLNGPSIDDLKDTENISS